jgi:hypothetical protein
MFEAVFSTCLTGIDEGNYRGSFLSGIHYAFSFKFRVFNKSKAYVIILYILMPLTYPPRYLDLAKIFVTPRKNFSSCLY